jgi:transcriptional regulator with XRE-family HTH domain
MNEFTIDWIAVGQRLRAVRKKTGYSQREFGQMFGVSQNTISLYEKGRNRAPADFFLGVAQLGGQTIEWLLRGQEDHTSETLDQMRDLYGKMRNQLEVVRRLLDRQTDHAWEQDVLAAESSKRVRSILRAQNNLPACLRACVDNEATWNHLAMTGREVVALCRLVRDCGELSRDGLRLFLRLVRHEVEPPDRRTGTSRSSLLSNMAAPDPERPSPD